ncbi:MAG: polysaccharide deacetylase family protein [Oscillospiraceae bacterium]|jgi:peptidoglycan-N-acetylmuramic acid deacetylase|nr:polysaccharide deacetylase family protein [Oscillospiraceae bacterium]
MEKKRTQQRQKRSLLIFLPGMLLVAATILLALIVMWIRYGATPTLPYDDLTEPMVSSALNSLPPMQQDNDALAKEAEQSNTAITNTQKPADTQPGTSPSAATASGITSSGATVTGFMPLPELPVKTEKPSDIPKLPTTRIAYSYGVATGGKPHQISIDNQKFFDSKGYKALALDTKSTDKRLYLTFDVGYENGITGKILDTLKEKKVPAAFFATQHHLKTNPELAARMISEGHIVGNHSVTHPDFTTISRAKMIEEIQGFDNYLRKNFGYTSPYFRFPAGSYSEEALDVVQSLGFTSVFWSVAWADWDTSRQQGKKVAFDTITARLHPGAVILLHAVSTDDAEALGDIIDWARAQGYAFRALTEY